MKRLILHAGGPKTGSSYLQVLLAQQAAALRAAGVLVPAGRETGRAAEGKISSGNGLELANFLDPRLKHLGPDPDRSHVLAALENAMAGGDQHTIVLSSEYLVLRPNAPTEALLAAAERHGYEISYLFYVRSISDAAYSFYAQSVKRHNDTRPFSDFIEGFVLVYQQRIESAATMLDRSRIMVRNYDVIGPRLGAHFFKEVLAVPIEPDGEARINRALTFEELEILRYMNQFFPKNNAYSTYVSDAILYHTGPKAAYDFTLEPAEADLIADRFQGQVDRINQWLSGDLIYAVSPKIAVGPRRTRPFDTMDEVQLALLAQMVKDRVQEALARRAAG